MGFFKSVEEKLLIHCFEKNLKAIEKILKRNPHLKDLFFPKYRNIEELKKNYPKSEKTTNLFGYADLRRESLSKQIDQDIYTIVPGNYLDIRSKDLFKLLISIGCNLNIQYETLLGRQTTPLITAVENLDIELVMLLLNKGADVNLDIDSGKSPLHIALEYSTSYNFEIVKKLIEAGADINAKTEFGQTPLHRAVEIGKLEAVNLLLENGAGVNAIDNDKNTPLFFTMESGSIDIAERLIKAGADYRGLQIVYDNYFKVIYYQRRIYNQSYLEYVMTRIKHLGIVSPLILSFKWELIEILFHFLGKKEPLEQIDSDGNTLLTLAQKSSNRTTSFALALYFYWKYRSKEWWKNQATDNFLCDYCNASVYKMDTTFLYRNKLACEECCSQRLIIPHKAKFKNDIDFWGKAEIPYAIDFIKNIKKIEY
ncbi:MAG: ankyrin repeat domain-containing protein [Melioribacteraceae bacterium]|nr:MAG: ankyrin repeat domain-containing protein [Melioribacteraceae bacterium]